MAKLAAVLDSLDGVPEELQSLYVEEDGKFVLDADVEGHPKAGALKRALDRERRRAKDAEDRIPDGFDPDRWAQLLALEEEAQKGRLTDKQREEFDNLKGQLEGQFQKRAEKYEGRITRLEGALERALVTAQATEAIARQKGSVRLLLPHVQRHATMVEDGEDFTYHIVDEKGHTRLGEEGNMTFDELVGEMRTSDDFAGAFEGTGSSGGGAPPSGRPASGGGSKTVAAGDDSAFLSNLEGIASGDVSVIPE